MCWFSFSCVLSFLLGCLIKKIVLRCFWERQLGRRADYSICLLLLRYCTLILKLFWCKFRFHWIIYYWILRNIRFSLHGSLSNRFGKYIISFLTHLSKTINYYDNLNVADIGSFSLLRPWYSNAPIWPSIYMIFYIMFTLILKTGYSSWK